VNGLNNTIKYKTMGHLWVLIRIITEHIYNILNETAALNRENDTSVRVAGN